MTTPPIYTGNQFRILRESAGMSKKKLSQITRASRTTISEYEAGKHTFRASTYMKLINALETFKNEQK